MQHLNSSIIPMATSLLKSYMLLIFLCTLIQAIDLKNADIDQEDLLARDFYLSQSSNLSLKSYTIKLERKQSKQTSYRQVKAQKVQIITGNFMRDTEIGGEEEEPTLYNESELTPYVGTHLNTREITKQLLTDQNPSIQMSIGLIYVGPLYMGTGANEIQVVYDTGSDNLAVEIIDCSNCQSNTYNPGTSIAFRKQDIASQTSTSSQNLIYNSASLSGYIATDHVYLDPLKWFGVKNFEWFAVTSQSGIVRTKTQMGSLVQVFNFLKLIRVICNTLRIEQEYIGQIVNQKRIDQKIYCFYLSQNESYVQFGAYSTEFMRNETELVWLPIPLMSQYWIGYVTNVWIGKPPTANFTAQGRYMHITLTARTKAIFDTGTTLVYLPSSSEYGAQIISEILRNKTYKSEEGFYIVDCDINLYPTVFFHLEDHYFEIPPSIYIIHPSQLSVNQTQPACFLGFTVGQNQPYFLFGDVFLRNYYAIHDLEKGQLGLVPHRYSDARIIDQSLMKIVNSSNQNGTTPPTPPPGPDPQPKDPVVNLLIKIVGILIIFIVCILLPILVVVLVLKYFTFKLPSQMLAQEEDSLVLIELNPLRGNPSIKQFPQ